MVSTMTTRNVGRRTTITRGGVTSEQDGREGERSRDQAGCGRGGQGSDRGSSRGNEANEGGDGVPDFATIITQQLQNLRPTIVAQVGNHVNNQGNNKNQDDNVINNNNQGNVRTVNMKNGRGGCSYKEFMACNLNDYDGKGGARVYTLWIEKMELVQDMSGRGENQKVQTRGREAAVGMAWEDFKLLLREEFCPNNEMQKLETEFWCPTLVGAGHAAYTNRFHELARLVPHLVTPENKRINRYIYGIVPQIHEIVAVTEPKIIQSAILKARMLTNEAIRNEALKKNIEKRGNNGESGRDGNVRNDNKMFRTERAFATITNPVRNEYTGIAPKCPNCNYHHQPEVPCHLCTNYNRFRHIAKDYKVRPRAVNPLNARNPTTACRACFECGGTDHYKATCPRLNPTLRPGGSRPNQVMAIEGGQGRKNNGNPIRGRAFVMGAEEARQDLNIMRGTFTLNNHYAMTLFDFGADYSFVSTTFVPLLYIEPSNLEIEGHTFDINLIPFGHGSFDVIVRMDWLSTHKAKIVCHEKVVRIPLQNDEMLRVLGERPREKVRHSKSAKVKEQKLKDIVVIRNFSEVFPNDLLGLPPSQEIEFHIDLISGEMPAAKSPYCLRPSEIEKLSSQLRELQDKTKEEYEMHLRLVLDLLKKEKLFANDYDCKIRYHPGKANVVADALSRKERIKPKRVRAMNMTIQSSIKDKILAGQNKASKAVNAPAKMLRGLDEQIKAEQIGHRKLTKSAHFLPMRKDYKMDRLARLYLNEIVTRHGVPILIISDLDSHFALRFWQSMQEVLGTQLDMSTTYDPQTDGQSKSTILTLKDKLRAYVLDFEGSWDVHLPLVEFSYNNSYHYSIRLKAARDRQKSYTDKKRKPLEFRVGNHVLLKVSPLKGVVRFGKKGKLAPRFVGPFKITERIDPVAYRLRLPEELNGVHDTFHVSNLKKCLADPTLQIPLEEI
ncbi:putative reverse transcriptase domain-containing protein [Tanacetum coccineum]|uniref:Reverse transcriptase domain-containing protein n=1 Tax=Tanacetum coccineum TaxID=301880 RepID=A0ABQ5GLA4_9ASTR